MAFLDNNMLMNLEISKHTKKTRFAIASNKKSYTLTPQLLHHRFHHQHQVHTKKEKKE